MALNSNQHLDLPGSLALTAFAGHPQGCWSDDCTSVWAGSILHRERNRIDACQHDHVRGPQPEEVLGINVRVLRAFCADSSLGVIDLTPNVGMWWYFFNEMFDHFRPFFRGVFQVSLPSGRRKTYNTSFICSFTSSLSVCGFRTRFRSF